MQNRPLRVLITLSAVLLFLGSTMAQVKTRTAEKVKIEHEDDFVRVLRVHYEPGESPARRNVGVLSILLTPFFQHIKLSSGAMAETYAPLGETRWFDANATPPSYAGEPATDRIEIEFKKAKAPAVTIPPNVAENRAKYYPVEIEPHHHLSLGNQYVRVLDVHIPPGAMTEYHRHVLSAVTIRLSDNKVSEQRLGQPWGKSEIFTTGAVEYSSYPTALVHRVRNDAAEEMHLLLIEIAGS